MLWTPAVGVEAVGVQGGEVGGVPDGGEVVDGVGGDGEDGAGGEMVGEDGDAGARGHDAGEAEGGGRVDAQGFGYYVVETVGTVLAWRS